MSEYPEDRRYTNEHEWTKIAAEKATVGITGFAVEQLGDVTMVELPAVGDAFARGDVFGTVESVKAVSDLYAPVGGTITKVNEALADQPELVNEDCLGQAWLVEIEMSDPSEAEGLLSAADYTALVAEQG